MKFPADLYRSEKSGCEDFLSGDAADFALFHDFSVTEKAGKHTNASKIDLTPCTDTVAVVFTLL